MTTTNAADKKVAQCDYTHTITTTNIPLEVLAIIPARGGSKGVKHKNIRKLGDLPLVAYSINAARQSKLISRVIVSTDDERIAAIAREHGAETPFMRPCNLASDKALIGSCLNHALSELRGQEYLPDATVTLYPTHPFRTPAMLDHLVGKLYEGYSPVRSVKAVSPAAKMYAKPSPDGRLQLMQSLPGHAGSPLEHYRSSGLFYGSLHSINDKPYVHKITNQFSHIDLDTEKDFELAEEVIRQSLFNFSGNTI